MSYLLPSIRVLSPELANSSTKSEILSYSYGFASISRITESAPLEISQYSYDSIDSTITLILLRALENSRTLMSLYFKSFFSGTVTVITPFSSFDRNL